MSRRIAFGVGLVAALGMGGGLVVVRSAGLGAGKSSYKLEKARVDRGDIVGKVTATGTLTALVTVQVGSQVSGRIAQLMVDFGSRVRKGQVIARLDARLFQAASEQSRANSAAAAGSLAQARAEADNAELQLRRAQKLGDEKLIAQAELESKMAGAAAARAAVQSALGDLGRARAAHHQDQVNLGYTTVVSPIDGIVISRNVDVGQTVAASLQAPTLFTIAGDLGKMQVHAAVSEADVGKLAPGMRATFVVDAYPERRFEGVIRQIRDAPQSLQNVVTYDAVIDVDNPEHKLKPGMTANVTFIHSERKDALRIPSAALRFRAPPELLAGDGGKKHKKDKDKSKDGDDKRETAQTGRGVYVLRGERLVEVPVQVGIADGSRVEVIGGDLHEGDVLVTDAISKAERAEAKRKGLF